MYSCPEDRSSAWINIKHSEVAEIHPECFPGASGRSWTVAFTAVRLCLRTTVGRVAPLLPRPPPVARLWIFQQLCRSIEERRMDLSYLRIVGRRPCSQLSCNSKGHCVSRTSRSVGSIQNVDCVYIAPIGHGGKGGIVWLRKKDLGDVPLLS